LVSPSRLPWASSATRRAAFLTKDLTLIRDLTQAIKQLPHVGRPMSSASPPSPGCISTGMASRIRPIDEASAADVTGCEALKQDVLSYKLYRGTLVAADGSAACVLIRLHDERYTDEITTRCANCWPNSPSMTSASSWLVKRSPRPHGQGCLRRRVAHELFRPFDHGFLIVLAYRTVRGTILPLCVIGAGSAMALGLMG